MPHIDISVCIATYRRPALLRNLLESVANQKLAPAEVQYEIIVVDNDKRGSARDIVASFLARHYNRPVIYSIEARKNISLARNRSVRLARGALIAFIDDDEYAPPLWLAQLRACMAEFDADAVFGPVHPDLPNSRPSWIKDGAFYTKPARKDGTLIREGRTSNTLVKREWLDAEPYPFNPKFGLTGGGDYDFFRRIQDKGARLCAAEHAVVYERILPDRLTLRWLLARAFRSGQGYAAKRLEGRGIIFQSGHYLYRAVLCLVAVLLVITSLPLGRSHAVRWLRKLFANVGQLSVILPYRYREYE